MPPNFTLRNSISFLYGKPAHGRELGPDTLAAFTETKNVFITTD